MNITTTTQKAFEWKASLEDGNSTIQTYFVPWINRQNLNYVDLPGSVLDRKFGIDGIMINPVLGKAVTVQVKKDSRIGETGNIYFETTKIIGNDKKSVTAEQIFYIDTTAMMIYSMNLKELQTNWHALIGTDKPKSVNTFNGATGQKWAKAGYAVPVSRVKELITSFKGGPLECQQK